MRKLLLIAALAALGTASTADASGPVFTVVPSTQPMTAFASSDIPNSGIVLPPSYLSPRDSAGLPFPVLQGYWQRAGATYGIPWQVLAAINKVESNFGRNMGPSSAGAIGWMQFMPSTWERWGMDADGDGIADPWNPQDAIFAAARYLAAAGGRTDISRGVFAYNHAQWYVDEVLGLARLYGQNGTEVPFVYDRLQVNLQSAQRAVARQNRLLVKAELVERQLAGRARQLDARAKSARLLSDRLELQKDAFQMDTRRAGAAQAVLAARKKLKAAESKLSHVRSSSWTSSFAPGTSTALGGPSYQGNYVFPVGGGASIVSVGHRHHDYPAADIAAPEGSPVYAITDGVIVDAWQMPDGRCGIGFTMRSALDGREWTYCHLSYEDPTIGSGATISAGQPVGLVGHTGHATGPHLHLQLHPASSYPQDEPWFEAFAGSAFTWQDAPTMDTAGPVFEIVGGDQSDPVIGFTLDRS
jgi:murein DD-endopeptidase MepM/ murein hydrolase activator NlpD